MQELKNIISNFIDLEKVFLSKKTLENQKEIAGISTALTAEIRRVESRYGKEDILKELVELRNIHSRSPFISRLQQWPLGYQGDYETIEYICKAENKCQPETIEYYLEEIALQSPIAEQHRNKVLIQSRRILETVSGENQGKKKNILIVGCGSGKDISDIQEQIKTSNIEITLNDMDKSALDYTRARLFPELLDKTVFVEKNILQYIRDLSRTKKKFDLVLFGGVFDYLTDKQIAFILSNIYRTNLSRKGKILWTNINVDNPYRCWIEYLGDWTLIERSQKYCRKLCVEASIPNEKINISLEETGLTNIIEIQR